MLLKKTKSRQNLQLSTWQIINSNDLIFENKINGKSSMLLKKTKSRGNLQLSTYLNVFEDSDKLDRAGDTQAICVDVKLRSNWFSRKEF